jgi:hypothetical protein
MKNVGVKVIWNTECVQACLIHTTFNSWLYSCLQAISWHHNKGFSFGISENSLNWHKRYASKLISSDAWESDVMQNNLFCVQTAYVLATIMFMNMKVFYFTLFLFNLLNIFCLPCCLKCQLSTEPYATEYLSKNKWTGGYQIQHRTRVTVMHSSSCSKETSIWLWMSSWKDARSCCNLVWGCSQVCGDQDYNW